MKEKGIANSIAAIRSGQKIEVMSLVSSTPDTLALAASISKLVKDRQPVEHTAAGTRKIRTPDLGYLQSISDNTNRNIAENATIHEMLPDNEACIQLLVSSVLSPKDLMNVELIFSAGADILPPNVTAGIINLLRNYFDQHYKIKGKLPKILREVLFTKGSYVLAVLPENAIDDLINRDSGIAIESIVNQEQFKKHFANTYLLGPRSMDAKTAYKNSAYGLESIINRLDYSKIPATDNRVQIAFSDGLFALENLTVVDNSQVLKLPKISDKIRHDMVQQAMNIGTESINASSSVMGMGSLADKRLMHLIYKGNKNNQQTLQASKSQNQLSRLSVTGPLIMHIPSGAVIPVFVPGQPDKHVAYYILLDGSGNPVSEDERLDGYRHLSNHFQNQKSQQSQLVSRLSNIVEGLQCPDDMRNQVIVNTYADLIEQDLLARMRNGKYNNDYALGRNEDVFRVMLARVLSQRRTQILFLPIEQVTYFATKYNSRGIGVSIMDDAKIVNNLRAIVTVTNTLNQIRNSIGRTLVDIKLDPDDPDPRRRFEEIRAEVIRSQHLGIPIGADSMTDMVNSLQMGQYVFKTSGNEMMPEMEIDISQNQSSYPEVDVRLEEQLRKRGVAASGLTVEQVDSNFEGDTATSVVSSNIMLSRKVMITQDELTPHLTDHLRKVALATPDVMDQIQELVENSYEELDVDEEEIKKLFNGDVNVKNIVVKQMVKDFMNGLEITLPRPTTVSLENQKAMLEVYIDVLDIALKAYIDEDMLSQELIGEVSTITRSAIASIRAYYIRQFCADNAILPELFKISTLDDNGSTEFDLGEMQVSHIEGVMRNMGKLLSGLVPKRKQMDAVVAAADPNASDDLSSGGGDYSSSDPSPVAGDDLAANPSDPFAVSTDIGGPASPDDDLPEDDVPATNT